MMRNSGHRFAVVAGWVLGAIALLVVCLLVWTQTVMPGDRAAALKAWRDDAISIRSTDHSIVMTPTDADGSGLVFIPGAKVDPYAYLYKLSGIAADGTTVVVTKPTLNLAFFDTRPLGTFTADAPDVTDWFVGGHSLGGVRACMLADDPAVGGLVLFGSYCANDLSHTSLGVLSIAGGNDGLSTPQKIADSAHLLPQSTQFVQIDGANHAAFGDYGVQPGDGVATVGSRRVREEITRASEHFIGSDRG
ncbi:alpha/beta hydrolase [Rathayibacter sp. YIM 133350]|uniref:alpha/beta hydrolase n=1 Tax=Rathayibacter sp. YIM 133350 TaxID=3131992 RepID=UPI00307DB8B9